MERSGDGCSRGQGRLEDDLLSVDALRHRQHDLGLAVTLYVKVHTALSLSQVHDLIGASVPGRWMVKSAANQDSDQQHQTDTLQMRYGKQPYLL